MACSSAGGGGDGVGADEPFGSDDGFSSVGCAEVECSQPENVILANEGNSTQRAHVDDRWGDDDDEALMGESTQGGAEDDSSTHASAATPLMSLDIPFGKPRGHPRIKITVSHVSSADATRVRRLADANRCDFFLDGSDVPTHIIIGSEPKATMLLLKGISRGCWVLDKTWADDSIGAGCLKDEEEYEVRERAGCRPARRARSMKLPRLFATGNASFVPLRQPLHM